MIFEDKWSSNTMEQIVINHIMCTQATELPVYISYIQRNTTHMAHVKTYKLGVKINQKINETMTLQLFFLSNPELKRMSDWAMQLPDFEYGYGD